VRHRASFGPSNRSRLRRIPSPDYSSDFVARRVRVQPRRAPGTSPRAASGNGTRALLVGVLLALTGCATWNPPPPQAAERAAAADVYSGSLRVSVKGEDVRGRSRVLVAFRRPSALRLEIPGSAGARLVAVVRGDRLTAIFPSHRAVLESSATAADFDALLGVALAPEELMDVLVGLTPPRLRSYRAGWGEQLPERIEAELPDGTRLKARVDDAQIGVRIPEAAFEFPAHPGYRSVDANEARRLLGRR
jgi:outer membrane lipoprotein-sorting protein